MSKQDVIIVGGGIVGLATAYRLLERFPDLKLTVIEKEDDVARHQTGRNSGVLHSGVYYKPGSLRATNCRQGKLAMQEFCEREEIPFDLCGKVIVAVNESEFPALDRIYERGQANGVTCEMIDKAGLDEIEPHTSGIKAIHVPEAGIVDYAQVCLKLAEKIRSQEAQTLFGTRVEKLENSGSDVVIKTSQGDLVARHVINCAGLHSDRVARMSGADLDARIVPFRGEYFELTPDAEHLCRGLIYPVPDPKFPFLGVHFTRMIQGGVECGPNAVLAFAREGYFKTDINVRDLYESLTYSGFLKLALRNWKTGIGEMWRSFSKAAFVRALQRLVPDIREEHLEVAPAGVRAQALAPDGKLVDDFLIQQKDRVTNVCNAPSPAATASLNIGKTIVDRLESQLS